jgi:hypothetical protein
MHVFRHVCKRTLHVPSKAALERIGKAQQAMSESSSDRHRRVMQAFL